MRLYDAYGRTPEFPMRLHSILMKLLIGFAKYCLDLDHRQRLYTHITSFCFGGCILGSALLDRGEGTAVMNVLMPIASDMSSAFSASGFGCVLLWGGEGSDRVRSDHNCISLASVSAYPPLAVYKQPEQSVLVSISYLS